MKSTGSKGCITTTSTIMNHWCAMRWRNIPYLRTVSRHLTITSDINILRWDCLHWILCQDRHVILFEDDMTLRCDWDETVKRLNYLPPDFNVAQLNYNHEPRAQSRLPYYGQGWEIGIKSNGTLCNVYSPRGAQILYDALMKTDRIFC